MSPAQSRLSLRESSESHKPLLQHLRRNFRGAKGDKSETSGPGTRTNFGRLSNVHMGVLFLVPTQYLIAGSCPRNPWASYAATLTTPPD